MVEEQRRWRGGRSKAAVRWRSVAAMYWTGTRSADFSAIFGDRRNWMARISGPIPALPYLDPSPAPNFFRALFLHWIWRPSSAAKTNSTMVGSPQLCLFFARDVTDSIVVSLSSIISLPRLLICLCGTGESRLINAVVRALMMHVVVFVLSREAATSWRLGRWTST